MSARRPNPVVALALPTIALAGSAVVTVMAALQSNSAAEFMKAGLESGTGTVAEVYGAQSSIVVSSGLLTAGIVGIVVSLAVFALLIGFGALSGDDSAEQSDEFIEDEIDDEIEGLELEDATDAEATDAAAEAEPADAASTADAYGPADTEPATATEAEPASDEPRGEASTTARD